MQILCDDKTFGAVRIDGDRYRIGFEVDLDEATVAKLEAAGFHVTGADEVESTDPSDDSPDDNQDGETPEDQETPA